MDTSRNTSFNRWPVTRLLIVLLSAGASFLVGLVGVNPRANAVENPTPAIGPLPVPDMTVLAKTERIIRDLFGNYQAANANDRDATAVKMLQQAMASQDDPAARYQLLKDAADLAAGAGDARTALHAADLLASSYKIEGGELKYAVLHKSATIATDPVSAKVAADEGLNCVNEAVAAGNLDLAGRLTQPTETAARNSKNPALLQSILARISEIKWMQSEQTRGEAAIEELAKSPGDPEANLAYGRYFCVLKGDFTGGLSALVKCSNSALRAAALADLARPASPDRQVDAGDLWWGVADKEPPVAQKVFRRRAGYWYSLAAANPQLRGLSRAVVEKRLGQIPPASTAHVDLLRLFSNQTTTVGGTWEMTREGLLCLKGGRLLFHYSPPPEYDINIEFARRTGNDSCAVIFPMANGELSWVAGGWGNRFVGFTHFANGGWHALAKHDVDNVLPNGKRATATIRVRRASVQAIYNGQIVAETPGDAKGLNAGKNEIDGKQVIALHIDEMSTAIVYKLEVVDASRSRAGSTE